LGDDLSAVTVTAGETSDADHWDAT